MSAPSLSGNFVHSALPRLLQFHLFEGLDEVALEPLATSCTELHLLDGQSLVLRGQAVDALYLIEDGQLTSNVYSPNGKRHLVAYQPSGNVFGMIALIDGLASVHDIEAVGATRLLRLPRAAFLIALAEVPGLTLRALEMMCLRARRTFESLSYLQLLPLEPRIASVLLSLVTPSKTPPHGPDATTLHLSQSDLADMLSVSRQSLNASLKAMERQGLLHLGHMHIRLDDVQGLQRLVG